MGCCCEAQGLLLPGAMAMHGWQRTTASSACCVPAWPTWMF
jgi:hypothetical protein